VFSSQVASEQILGKLEVAGVADSGISTGGASEKLPNEVLHGFFSVAALGRLLTHMLDQPAYGSRGEIARG